MAFFYRDHKSFIETRLVECITNNLDQIVSAGAINPFSYYGCSLITFALIQGVHAPLKSLM